ncbi:anthrax toxin lethal factor-related metalloendopeptidase [Clostridium perfringens]
MKKILTIIISIVFLITSLLIIYYFYFYNSFRLSESKLVIDKLSYLADTIEISTKENKLYEVDLKKDLDTYEINILELLFKEHLLDNNGVDISYTKSNIYLSIPSDTLNISEYIEVKIKNKNGHVLKRGDFNYKKSIKLEYFLNTNKVEGNIELPKSILNDGEENLGLTIKSASGELEFNTSIQLRDVEFYITDDLNITPSNNIQEYSYNITIDKDTFNNKEQLKEYLVDKNPPQRITNLSFKDGYLKFNKGVDIGTDYSIKLEATGNEFGDTIINTIDKNIKSGVNNYQVEIFKDDKLFINKTIYENELDLKSLEAGKYKAIVRCVDNSGNYGEDSEYDFTVNKINNKNKKHPNNSLSFENNGKTEVDKSKPSLSSKPQKPLKPTVNIKPTNTENPNSGTKPSINNKPNSSNKPNSNNKPNSSNKPNSNNKPNSTPKPDTNQKPNKPNVSPKPETPIFKPNPEKDAFLTDIIKKDGKVTSSDINLLKKNLYELPNNILDRLKRGGFKIILTSRDIKEYYPELSSNRVSGYFDPMKRTIYISNFVEGNVNYIDKATIHEVGHAVDLFCGEQNYVSLEDEWDDIYKAESHTATSSYYKANPQEYFADSFRRFILNPKQLKKSSPKTYTYISEAVSEL